MNYFLGVLVQTDGQDIRTQREEERSPLAECSSIQHKC